MSDVTPELMLERLRSHYGEWVVKDCTNKGEPGIIVEDVGGKMFIVTVIEVKGVTARQV